MNAAPDVVTALHAHIARIEHRNGATADYGHFPTGFHSVDAHCDGGLRRGAIHEFLSSGAASSSCGRTTRFLARILSRTTGPLLWVSAPPSDLHLAGLIAVGLAPDRVLCVEVRPERALAVAEDILREKSITALIVDLATPLSLTTSRRLQLAAASSGVTGFILHRSISATPPSTACWSRWRIGAAPHATAASYNFLTAERWSIDLLRLRGGDPASFTAEPDHDTSYPLPVASRVAHAALVPTPSRYPHNIAAGAAYP